MDSEKKIGYGILEFIPPSIELANDIKKIIETGKNLDSNSANAERVKLIRNLLKKWDGKLHKNFVETLENIIVVAEKNEIPQLPDENAYDFSDKEQLKNYISNIKKAWEELKDYYENKSIKNTFDDNSLQGEYNKTVFITNELVKLYEMLIKKQDKRIQSIKSQIILSKKEEYGGAIIAIAENKSEHEIMKKIGMNPNDERLKIVSLPRYIFYENMKVFKELKGLT